MYTECPKGVLAYIDMLTAHMMPLPWAIYVELVMGQNFVAILVEEPEQKDIVHLGRLIPV